MRVGTRCSLICSSCYTEDHPHACGDKLTSRAASLRAEGSSPCVWGQEKASTNVELGRGIIPMRVGTSRTNRGCVHAGQDHPHACGDKTKEIKENSGFAKSTA